MMTRSLMTPARLCALPLLMLAASAWALEPTAAEQQRDDDVAALTDTLTCQDWRSAEMFEALALRLGAHRTVVNTGNAQTMYLGGETVNADYTFPTGLRLQGMTVNAVSLRQEFTTPDQYQYLAYGAIFTPDSAQTLAKRFQITRPENPAGVGERRGWFNQHDFKVRGEQGVNALTCGYWVRTPARSLTNAGTSLSAWVKGLF